MLLRFTPGDEWPLLIAAVRDEFVHRTWDPPDAHWPTAATVVGGRDHQAGGTWLAVRADRPAVSALLNGPHRPASTSVARPSRGRLPLAVLNGDADLSAAALRDYDGFHLLHGTTTMLTVWTWDRSTLTQASLDPGDHIIVNAGTDTADDPLVPHFLPLLRTTPTPIPAPGSATTRAWGAWVDLLRGDGLPMDDPRALVVRHTFDQRTYGSTSASLVAVSRNGVRLDFTATPSTPAWAEVPLPQPPTTTVLTQAQGPISPVG